MSPLSINLSRIPYPEVKNTKIVGDFHDYLIKNGANITSKRGLRTENINSCTAGILDAGERHFMFHAAPEMQPLSSIKKELAKQIELLKRSCDDIRGFICGGWELNANDKESIRSFDLYNTIADALDSLGVRFAMFCGKEKGAPLDNLHSINGNVTLWNDNFKNIIDSKKYTKDELLDVLENQYQFVDSNSDETVQFLDKFTPKVQHLVG